jgi:hypothetical protein
VARVLVVVVVARFRAQVVVVGLVVDINDGDQRRTLGDELVG